ncbi:MAG: tRNA (guanosine(37)-N1)-methyltransferase TrmD, partial [Terracidiphilus sp.]
DRHRTVDDRPFGGGEGMVLKPEPLAEALEALGVEPRTSVPADDAGAKAPSFPGPSSARLKSSPDAAGVTKSSPDATCVTKSRPDATCVILLSAQGRPFTQGVARELAGLDRVVLICGRYEGVDERINQLYCDMELSIGDYVLSGGELAAAVVLDATMRLIPGVLGNEASGEFESFGAADAAIATDVEGVPRSQHGAGGLLDYPHYTRPAEFRGLKAPEVLLNGDHRQIRKWRREQQLLKTLANRPDLIEKAELSEAERRLIAELRESAS